MTVQETNISTALAKAVRMSPIKLRRVANIVRGVEVEQALAILKRTPNKGSDLIYAVIKSAKSNAVHNKKIQDPLVVSELLINEGPKFKRYQPKARGRMNQITKRTSHIFVGLNTVQGAVNGK